MKIQLEESQARRHMEAEKALELQNKLDAAQRALEERECEKRQKSEKRMQMRQAKIFAGSSEVDQRMIDRASRISGFTPSPRYGIPPPGVKLVSKSGSASKDSNAGTGWSKTRGSMSP